MDFEGLAADQNQEQFMKLVENLAIATTVYFKKTFDIGDMELRAQLTLQFNESYLSMLMPPKS